MLHPKMQFCPLTHLHVILNLYNFFHGTQRLFFEGNTGTFAYYESEKFFHMTKALYSKSFKPCNVFGMLIMLIISTH